MPLQPHTKRILLITYFYTVLRGIGRSAFMILFPLYLLSIGYSTESLGGVVTYSSLLMITILPIVGFMVDKGWSNEVLGLSGLFLSLSLILPLINSSYVSLVLSYTLSMLSLFLWSPARNRIIGGIVSEHIMGRIFSIFILVFNVSRMVTSFIIGRITYIGYAELMFYIGLIILIGSITTYVLIHAYHKEEERIKINKASILCSYKSMFLFPRNVLPLILFTGLDSFGWKLWFPLLNSYLKEYKMLTDPEIGDFNTVLSFAMMITAYAAGHITDKIKPTGTLLIYEVIGAIGIIFLLADKPLILAASIFIGFSISFWVSAYNKLITLVYGVGKAGRLRALTDSVRNIAGVPAPKIGGILLSINPIYAFMTSIFFMLLATTPLIYAGKHREITNYG